MKTLMFGLFAGGKNLQAEKEAKSSNKNRKNSNTSDFLRLKIEFKRIY